jgi:cell wall-associated NlpC family hydrolase
MKILALLLLLPVGLSAQSRTVVSGYMATDPGVAGNPLLVGGTVARELGPLSGRLSLGFDVSTPPAGRGGESELPIVSGIWSSDADALLFLGNPRGSSTLIPYGVAGVGVRGITEDGGLGVEPNYSYGGGFRAPIGAGFSIEGEARYRDAFAKPVEGRDPRVSSGLEFRFGVSLGWGGGPRVRVPASAAPSRPVLRPSSIPTGLVPSLSTYSSADSRMRVAAATLNTASNYIGVPYRWGGNTPQEGFDCSGFIRYVFNLNGISVPRVSQDQARFGTPLPLEISQFQPGDILAFSSTNGTVDHTALYVGNGRIIHSSSSGSGVRYDDLYSDRGEWFRNHMVAARRVIDGGIHLSGR